jgi:hypothetical protein
MPPRNFERGLIVRTVPPEDADDAVRAVGDEHVRNAVALEVADDDVARLAESCRLSDSAYVSGAREAPYLSPHYTLHSSGVPDVTPSSDFRIACRMARQVSVRRAFTGLAKPPGKEQNGGGMCERD